MDALLGGPFNIRTNVNADHFNAKTDVDRHNEEASDNDGKNNVSSMFMSTLPCVGRYKVATTTPKLSIFFNQLVDIKVDYFGNFN